MYEYMPEKFCKKLDYLRSHALQNVTWLSAAKKLMTWKCEFPAQETTP